MKRFSNFILLATILLQSGVSIAAGKNEMESIFDHIKSSIDKSSKTTAVLDPTIIIVGEKNNHPLTVTWSRWVGGDKIVSTGPKRELVIWDAVSGKPFKILGRDEKSSYRVLGVSHDGKYIASGNGKNEKRISIRIWNSDTGSVEKDIIAPNGFSEYRVVSLGFSQNGKYLVAMFWCQVDMYSHQAHYFVVRYTVGNWDESGRIRHVGAPMSGTDITVSSTGAFAAGLSYFYQGKKRTFNVYDFEKGEIRETAWDNPWLWTSYNFQNNNDDVIYIGGPLTTFKPGTNTVLKTDIAIGNLSSKTNNISNSKSLKFKLPQFVKLVDFLVIENNNLLILGYDNRVVEVRNINTGGLISSFKARSKYIYSMDYEKTSNMLLVTDGYGITTYNIGALIK